MSMSSPGDTVISQILAQAPDAPTAEAMLLGSSFEGGWGPTFATGDQGTSYGPFQIHLPAHPGVTPTEAEDPAWATSYMLPAYEAGVKSVPGSEWQSNPELAAEQAAVAAERPARSYLDSYGSATLNQHWSSVQGALTGKTLPASSGGGSPSSGSSSSASLTAFNPFSSSDWKTIVFEGIFIAAGVGLIVLGIFKTASPGGSITKTVAGTAKKAGEAAVVA